MKRASDGMKRVPQLPRAIRKRVDQDAEIWKKHNQGWQAQRIADFLQLSTGTVYARLRYLRKLYPIVSEAPADDA